MRLDDVSGRFPSDRSRLAGQTATRTPTRRESFPALPPRLRPGDRLGSYLLVDEIACGSHSTVFRAEHRQSGDRVALKVLSIQLAVTAEGLEGFAGEIELHRRVEHEAIVRILESGNERGYRYFAMPLATGGTLEDAAADAPFHRDLSFFADLAARFVPIARAVHALHAARIVHRDLKPANILIAEGGELLLTDFGSAIDTASARAGSRSAGGTVLYLAPEQLLPGADPTDPRADIYSLGATLYEALTGTPPFPPVDDAEIARLKITRQPPPARRVHPHVPLALDAIVRRAMSTAMLRPGSTLELAHELERFTARHAGGGRAR